MTAKRVKEYLIALLKSSAVKLALVKILGSATVGGFKAMVIKYIVENLFEYVALPIINFSIRKGFLFYDKTRGKILIKRINQAKDDDDKEEYRRNIGRV